MTVGAAVKVASGGELARPQRRGDQRQLAMGGFETPNGEKPEIVARWIGPFDVVVQGGDPDMPDDGGSALRWWGPGHALTPTPSC